MRLLAVVIPSVDAAVAAVNHGRLLHLCVIMITVSFNRPFAAFRGRQTPLANILTPCHSTRVVCPIVASSTGEKVTVTFRDNRKECKKGQLLRTALLKSELTPHNGRSKWINCRGLGTCGTCAVRIATGAVEPKEWTSQERLRLSFPPHSSPGNAYLRLACQVRLVEDTEVVKMAGFWGSSVDSESTELAGTFTAPFGKLEFIMDSRKE